MRGMGRTLCLLGRRLEEERKAAATAIVSKAQQALEKLVDRASPHNIAVPSLDDLARYASSRSTLTALEGIQFNPALPCVSAFHDHCCLAIDHQGRTSYASRALAHLNSGSSANALAGTFMRALRQPCLSTVQVCILELKLSHHGA